MSDEKTTLRQPPTGFKRLAPLSDAPWFQPQAGNTCVGKYLGRFVMNTDPPRAYHQVELSEPCQVRVGKKDEAKIVEAKKGDIINVGESYKIAILKENVTPECLAGAEYQVFIQTVKKIQVRGGRTMWDIDVQANCIKPATRPVRDLPPDKAVPTSDAEEGESDTPF